MKKEEKFDFSYISHMKLFSHILPYLWKKAAHS